jgi:putative membrane-bound dehydrogenase-like protein
MRIVPSLCLIAFGLSCLPSGLLAEQPEFRKSATNLDERLKPIPPKEPAEALQSFRAAHGFRMELVACEPDVADPVAAAFDENGLLYVAEMADYPDPYREGRKPLGRVRLLEDSDADGKFDRSWIFAEAICWPTGVVPWKQGIFVAAAPDIWYLKDTDGDHLADVRRQVFTGFGVQNQQGTVNNLAWGFDNRIYGSGSTNGGEIRSAGLPDGEPLSIHRKDFRFDPESETLEAVSGWAQFGNAFDDWGNRFVCSESEPGYHVVLPHEYLARNPYLAVERTIQELAPSPIRIYRTSPIEPWRAIRSQRRIAAGERGLASAGLSHEVIDAAAGLTIYRGDAYPEEFRGDLIIGCSQNNLIHRRKIVPDGVSFHSRRADKDTELVQSSDTWFRPVNCIHAPDGTLYVLDMSREVIEAIHIPLDVVARLDLASGRDRGRIYRLAPPGFQLRVAPRLGSADTLELVRTLEHRAGWWRDTASRLLYERQDPAAIGPLRALLRTSDFPQARLHALWALEGLRALDESDVMFALSDPSEHLREHAVRFVFRWRSRWGPLPTSAPRPPWP